MLDFCTFLRILRYAFGSPVPLTSSSIPLGANPLSVPRLPGHKTVVSPKINSSSYNSILFLNQYTKTGVRSVGHDRRVRSTPTRKTQSTMSDFSRPVRQVVFVTDVSLLSFLFQVGRSHPTVGTVVSGRGSLRSRSAHVSRTSSTTAGRSPRGV